jgi:hypothetical protein
LREHNSVMNAVNRKKRGRIKGSKNASTKAKAMLSAYSDAAPEIDFGASFDSLAILEDVMRHFYLRALIERRMGKNANWDKVDALLVRAGAAAEKVARYKHAQLAAIRLAGDLNAKVDESTLDELLVSIKAELIKLGPLIDLEAIVEEQRREPQGVENR